MKKTNINLEWMDNFFVQEAFKVLRTNIQFCGQDIKIVAITSASENEGKSTISLGVAESFAGLGKRVLLIDADMRKSVIASRYTDASGVVGLSEVLTGLQSINDCIYKTQLDGLYLLMAGQFPPNPSELLSGPHFETLLETLKKSFDYIFIDTPPLGAVIDSAVISSKCDGTILVCAGKVKKNKIVPVVNQLKRGNCNILGIVRNSVSNRSDGYYSKYGYKYGYGYGQDKGHRKKKSS